ncbi:hypothetical protein QYE76_057451 [Lolium multiflorum]|uniref:Transposase-associated domain-containing protein n=1 Tax=Lolium multiflorum TaxID=4521 RepID=A0AAD8WNT4_LOLMU|nr:hypothetical protein QYE76_057451 [Lolium multiflorum]
MDYSTSKTIHVHLLQNGFMPSYNCWTKHGERGVILEDNEEEEDSDNYPMFTEDGDSRMGEDEAEEEPIFDEPIFDDPDDDLGRAILDAKISCGSEKERLKLEKMLEDHKTLLYPNCKDGQKKLGTTLELLQWKAENGTSDKGFEKLLKIIKKMLPGENVLPSSTYEAKKVDCPLGLEVQKIHACINDCIFYRGEYENLNACPVCSALRYKIRRDDPSDVEGESNPRKRVLAKARRRFYIVFFLRQGVVRYMLYLIEQGVLSLPTALVPVAPTSRRAGNFPKFFTRADHAVAVAEYRALAIAVVHTVSVVPRHHAAPRRRCRPHAAPGRPLLSPRRRRYVLHAAPRHRRRRPSPLVVPLACTLHCIAEKVAVAEKVVVAV